jgi:hypothetical protein
VTDSQNDTPSGKELSLILDGIKPMASFYRAVSETHDEKSGQDFYRHVKSGELVENRFFIKNEGQNFKIVYTVYCRIGEEWRFRMYKEIKKIGQTQWGPELERLEGWLLGY